MPGILKKLRNAAGDREFKRLAGNSGWTSLAKIAKSAEVLVRSVIIARSAGVENYATFCILMAFVGTVQELFNSNAGSVVVKFGAVDLKEGQPERFKSLVRFCFNINCLLYLVSIFVVYVLGRAFYGNMTGFGFAEAALLIASTAGFAFVGGVLRSSLLLVDRFRAYSLTEIATACLNLGIVAAVVWFNPGDLFVIVLAVACSNLVTESLCALVYYFQMPKSLRGFLLGQPLERGKRNHVVKFLLGNSASLSFQKLAKKGDVLVVGIFATPIAVAIYDVAKKISGSLLLIVQPLSLAAFPQLARLIAEGEFSAIARMLKHLYTIITGPIIISLILLFFWGEDLVQWIYGDGFTGAGIPLTILAISSCVALAFFWCNTFVLAIGKLRRQFVAHLCGAIATLGSGPVLSELYGATGMAIAVLIGICISSAILLQTIHGHVKSLVKPDLADKPSQPISASKPT